MSETVHGWSKSNIASYMTYLFTGVSEISDILEYAFETRNITDFFLRRFALLLSPKKLLQPVHLRPVAHDDHMHSPPQRLPRASLGTIITIYENEIETIH